jgi:hypothetical protein
MSVRPLDSPSQPWSAPLRTARRAAAGLALGAGLLLGTAAAAAPTCVDSAGQTVRCEAPAALPVGAIPEPDADAAHDSEFPLPAPATLFGLVCVLGGLFALIGLMPDFDGWGPGEHEGPCDRD